VEHRGFVITGLAFGLLVVLLIAANYNVIANTQKLDSNTQNIKIDKVYNRYLDLKRALASAKSDGSAQNPSKCTEYLTSVLNSQLFDSDGVTVSGTVSGCSVSFTVETQDGSVHKEGSA